MCARRETATFLLLSCFAFVALPIIRCNAEAASEVTTVKRTATSGACLSEQRSRPGDTISYHYCGRLLSGKEFDCSFNYGKPYVFTIGTGQVIKGMDIGLTGVCVGDALKITIPSHLAYGNRATGSIPANSDLIFYVKVLRLDREGIDLSGSSTIFDLFNDGGSAYHDEDWASSIEPLEKVATLFFKSDSIRKNCTAACVPDTLLSRKWQVEMVKYGSCMQACLATATGRSYDPDGPSYRKEQLKHRKVYNFLQMAYYKIGDYEKAASAASTYFYFNPSDESAKYNVGFHLSQETIQGKEIPLMEDTAAHVSLLSKALKLYKEEEYSDAAHVFENVVTAYGKSWHTCCKNCYTDDLGDFPLSTGDMTYDLVVAFKKVLICQLDCATKMGTTPSYHHDNVHSEIYHHLQFAYSKIGKLDKGAEAMATAAHIRPSDLEGSLAFYQSRPELADSLKPRQEAVEIVQKISSLKQLLSAVDRQLPDDPLGDEGEVQDVTSGEKNKDPDVHLFSSRQQDPVGPPPESLVP